MISQLYMYRAVAYIEEHLYEDISLQGLADSLYVSYMQLYRDFYIITGHSLKEYIRKRRLSNALALVKHSDRTVTDIAYACGFGSQQSFCKAVKNWIHMSPMAFKKSEIHFVFPPCDIRANRHVTVMNVNLPKRLKLYFYDSQRAGIEKKALACLYDILPDFRGRLFGRNQKDGIYTGDNRFCYALYLTDYAPYVDRFRDSAFEVAGEEPETAGKGIFVTTTVRHDADEIREAWDYLYAAWLPHSMFRYTDEDYFEEYYAQGRKLRLYLPIAKKETVIRIGVERDDAVYLLSEGKDEESASRRVVSFLQKYHPEMLWGAACYVKKTEAGCICGVKVPQKVGFREGAPLSLQLPQEKQLVLQMSYPCDEEGHRQLLFRWAAENGFSVAAESFYTVYHTAPSDKNFWSVKPCEVHMHVNLL